MKRRRLRTRRQEDNHRWYLFWRRWTKRTASNVKSSGLPTEGVIVSDWTGGERVEDYAFPAPGNRPVRLRVAIEATPYAELIGHTRASLDREVCGVLVGKLGRDSGGLFVHVLGIITGESAREGGTHVTFTQETWNKIHKTLDKHYPKNSIVGWYHSHPGFGVIFSEMDLFIQRNFFSASHQVALVYDPLSGETGVCVNSPSGVTAIEWIWVGGKEVSCSSTSSSHQSTPVENLGSAELRLKELETRVAQLVRATDELRENTSRIMQSIGLLVVVAICIWLGITVYKSLFAGEELSPKAIMSNVPVVIGNKVMFLTVEFKSWEAPVAVQKQLLELLVPDSSKQDRTTRIAPDSPRGALPDSAGATSKRLSSDRKEGY